MTQIFKQGDQVQWTTLLEGKVTPCKGKVSVVVYDVLHLAGETVTGIAVHDMVYAEDKTLELLPVEYAKLFAKKIAQRFEVDDYRFLSKNGVAKTLWAFGYPQVKIDTLSEQDLEEIEKVIYAV